MGNAFFREAAKANQRLNAGLMRREHECFAHTLDCRDPACSILGCATLKYLLRHKAVCKKTLIGGCLLCKRLAFVCCLHSRRCNLQNCTLPFCAAVKQKFNEIKSKNVIKRRKVHKGKVQKPLQRVALENRLRILIKRKQDDNATKVNKSNGSLSAARTNHELMTRMKSEPGQKGHRPNKTNAISKVSGPSGSVDDQARQNQSINPPVFITHKQLADALKQCGVNNLNKSVPKQNNVPKKASVQQIRPLDLRLSLNEWVQRRPALNHAFYGTQKSVSPNTTLGTARNAKQVRQSTVNNVTKLKQIFKDLNTINGIDDMHNLLDKDSPILAAFNAYRATRCDQALKRAKETHREHKQTAQLSPLSKKE